RAARRAPGPVAAAHPVRDPLGRRAGPAAGHRRGRPGAPLPPGRPDGLDPAGRVAGRAGRPRRPRPGGPPRPGGGRAWAAGGAIVPVPPAVAGRISYRPAMPGWRNQLTQRVPMGSVIKVHAIYEEPFWRSEGLSGFVVSDSGPVRVVYDNSPEDGSPGVLVGFIE